MTTKNERPKNEELKHSFPLFEEAVLAADMSSSPSRGSKPQSKANKQRTEKKKKKKKKKKISNLVPDTAQHSGQPPRATHCFPSFISRNKGLSYNCHATVSFLCFSFVSRFSSCEWSTRFVLAVWFLLSSIGSRTLSGLVLVFCRVCQAIVT
jgi:hypothetical protein